ncbi:MAG TPA: ribonuclease HI family protein [Actinobacteria bacterium]|jgi:ribonuclease HI|nr:ribonuclease HI family protein [Actinomycetota bacterium]
MNKRDHTEVRVFTDGGSRGNPGPAAIGVVIADEKDNIISRFGKYIGTATNNVAEYSALIEALRLLREIDAYRVIFHTDSSLVYNQIKGFWKIKNPDIKLLNEQAKKMLYDLPYYNFIHIPREKNKDADRLVNKALDEQKKSLSQ